MFFSGLLSKILLAALLFCVPPITTATADPIHNEAVGRFYDELAPYGKWVDHPIYGEVWYPLNVPADWRPYTDGYWAYTNNYAWLWVSAWPWGWATFHYGRWVWDDWYGWIWVPGNLWAPAWVFWGYGNNFISWAPMLPDFIWTSFISYSPYSFDYHRFVPWYCWNIIRMLDFRSHYHYRPGNFIPLDRIREILKKTQFFNNMTVVNNHIVNRGIPVKQIEKATGIPLIPVTPEIITQKKSLRSNLPSQQKKQQAGHLPPFQCQAHFRSTSSGRTIGKTVRRAIPLIVAGFG